MTTTKTLPTLAQVVREQGRTMAWLARQTGFSEGHVRRVARGESPGSKPFHTAIVRLLGEPYREAGL